MTVHRASRASEEAIVDGVASDRGQEAGDVISLAPAEAASNTDSERIVRTNIILEVALNNMGRGLSMFGADQRLIVCNKMYREIYDLPEALCRPGTRLDDIIRFYVERNLGRTASDREVAEQRRWVCGHVEHLATQGGYSHEQRLQDGRILRVAYQPLPGGGWVDLQEDVTKHKKEEAKLRLAAAVLASTQEGIVITDPEGHVVTVNPAYSTISGFGADEMSGCNMRVVQSGRHGSSFYREMWQTIDKKDHWQGEIWNRRKNGEIYPALLTISAVRDDMGEIVNYVGTCTDVSRIKRSEVKLDHLAHHDALTDLPNRLLLCSRLEQAVARAKRRHEGGAVLFLDLDGFKTINDRFGHAVGDELLVHVAKRLSDQLREIDTLARIGGDEFVVLLENTSASAAAGVVQKLIGALSRPFTLSSGEEVSIGTTIGISLFPKDSMVASELVKLADTALYEAKNAERGTYRFYSAVELAHMPCP